MRYGSGRSQDLLLFNGGQSNWLRKILEGKIRYFLANSVVTFKVILGYLRIFVGSNTELWIHIPWDPLHS